MNKLYPIATAATRHLFVDPAIYHPFDIIDSHYSGEKSSFIKPGVVPNLMQLCMPEGVYYSVTEEPDFDEMYVEEILFGLHHNGNWGVFRVPVLVRLDKLNQSNWGFKGTIKVSTREPININTGVHGVDPRPETVTDDDMSLMIDLDINYARSTRCLEFTTVGNFDNSKPQILGMCFDLKYKDSKSTKSLFKAPPAEIKQTYRREIAA